MMDIVYLAFLAAIAVNSYIGLGFGVRELTTGYRSGLPRSIVPAVSIVLAGIVVQPLFSYILAPLALGYLELFLLLPVSVFVCMLVDSAFRTFAGPSQPSRREARPFSVISAFDGLVYASSYLTLRLASDFIEAIAISAGSAAGFLLCSVVLGAIRERSDVEPIPRCLRGAPLMILASGLFALLSTFLSAGAYAAFGGR